MTKNENLIYLNGIIPIRRIQEPFCKTCMNPVNEKGDICQQCLDPPPIDKNWYFNRIIALGTYYTYPNEPYSKIPINIISRMILTIKGDIKKPKKDVGKLIADGLFQLIQEYSFLIDNTSYFLIPPKDNPSEENQCKFFFKPLINMLKKKSYNIKDLTNKVKRKTSIGKNRDKPTREQRFMEINGTHEVDWTDLESENVLILDDIVTSKSTIWDISRALKEKNGGEINVLCIGRTLFISDRLSFDFFPSNLSFTELITYFSNLDNYLELKKINNVKIDNYYLDDNEINCQVGEYAISIDLENLKLKHSCPDFYRRRYRNKSFCKHLTKLFLEIKENEGEDKAREILNNIYINLPSWDFKNDLN